MHTNNVSNSLVACFTASWVPLPCMLANPLPCMLANLLRLASWPTHCLACCQSFTALHVAEVPLPCILTNFHCLACWQTSTALHAGQPTALLAWWTSCLNQPWLMSVRLGIELTVLVCKCCHSMRSGFPNCTKLFLIEYKPRKINIGLQNI